MGNAQTVPPPPPPPAFADTVAIAAEKSQGLLVVIVLSFAAISLGLRAVMGTTRPRRASEIAQSGQAGSPLADILAYNIVALGYAMGTAYIGTAAWFDGSAESIGGSLHDRMYGFSRPMELLGIATAAYEFFNVACAIMLPEYRNDESFESDLQKVLARLLTLGCDSPRAGTAAFIGHHVTTFVLALLSFHPWLHYYAIFFFGVASVSRWC